MNKPPATDKTPVPEQDNGWKEMLDEFFEEFVEFFFPAIHADIDWQRGYESLDKELPALGREHAVGKRIADKLVRVWLKDGRETWLLIHVEVQGHPEKRFNERTYVYNYRIFDKHHCEVVSLVVVTGRGTANTGCYEVARWGFQLRCTFPVIRLTDYRGREAELAADRNPFALVVLAQLRLLDAKNDPQKKLAAKRELIRNLLRSGRNRSYVKAVQIKISRKAAKIQRREGRKDSSKFLSAFSLCGFAALRETVDFIDVQFAQASVM
ncbi:MAG TPA: hypothetical protein PKC13_20680 [Blastocatellia bacterium]|nr:hypothetical protein [Blastocatellia bacterium]HMX28017.1 hypothetical protein [Blastocatellia bacterium]HMY76219.1 hypothetical protein [Blastocatellia bacterium]HNG31224.1 hypothetical protein [Blastocatellia bacterium]